MNEDRGTRPRRRVSVRGRSLLVLSIAVAVLVTVASTTALVLADPAASKAEALRTGGLTGGAVVALYALWLNDRRRRTEEARHELEQEKAADERFARAVELIGDPADPVRVGALHALAHLARSVPRYRQTVLDVLCGYLRMPVPDGDRPGGDEEADARERQVRATAQRLIADLLPWGQDTDPRRYHLDLTGATLQSLRLEGRRIGRLVAGDTTLHGATRLAGLDASKPVLLGGAAVLGPLDLGGARLAGGLSLARTTFASEVVLTGAVVETFADLRTAPPPGLRGELTLSRTARVDGERRPWAVWARSEPPS